MDSGQVLQAGFDGLWDSGRRYARRLVANQADGDDVVQEAFCRILTASGNGTPRSRDEWTAIFFRTVRNLAYDQLRRRKKRRWAAWPVGWEPPGRDGHPALENESRRQFAAAIQRLPDDWRQALLLRAAGDLSYDQISQVLQCSKAQVRTWIYRARRQLTEECREDDAVRRPQTARRDASPETE